MRREYQGHLQVRGGAAKGAQQTANVLAATRVQAIPEPTVESDVHKKRLSAQTQRGKDARILTFDERF
jgi:hypothetical protein